jgi:hypothetical protein
MFNVMLNVTLFSVVMLSVVVPLKRLTVIRKHETSLKKLGRDKRSSLVCCGVGDEE